MTDIYLTISLSTHNGDNRPQNYAMWPTNVHRTKGIYVWVPQKELQASLLLLRNKKFCIFFFLFLFLNSQKGEFPSNVVPSNSLEKQLQLYEQENLQFLLCHCSCCNSYVCPF